MRRLDQARTLFIYRVSVEIEKLASRQFVRALVRVAAEASPPVKMGPRSPGDRPACATKQQLYTRTISTFHFPLVRLYDRGVLASPHYTKGPSTQPSISVLSWGPAVGMDSCRSLSG